MLNPLWEAPGPPATCHTCAWRFVGGRGRAVPRCRRHDGARVSVAWPACPAYTEVLDCQTCGACCREAYHAVEVSRRDPFCRTHAEWLVTVDGRRNVRREGDRCAALEGSVEAGFTCVVYADRPRTCREFERGSVNCVQARRRVGLTP